MRWSVTAIWMASDACRFGMWQIHAGSDCSVRFVAGRAGAVRVGGGGLVGIVASGAGQTPLRFQEAHRLPQPIDLADHFELVVMAGVGRVIEILVVVAQRLAWLIREDAAVEFPDRGGQFGAGGFEMALHADFELAIRGEARRVDDGVTNIGRRFALQDRLGMGDPGAVAPLAVDALRKVGGEYRSPFDVGIALGDDRIRIVAKHAAVGCGAAEAWMFVTVIAWTHAPMTSLL